VANVQSVGTKPASLLSSLITWLPAPRLPRFLLFVTMRPLQKPRLKNVFCYVAVVTGSDTLGCLILVLTWSRPNEQESRAKIRSGEDQVLTN